MQSSTALPPPNSDPPTREFHILYRRRDRFTWCILYAPGPWTAYLQLRASFPREDVEIIIFHEASLCRSRRAPAGGHSALERATRQGPPTLQNLSRMLVTPGLECH